ncbi:hypothetical protein [Parabacteroides merdae]|uniref:Uncharacterized protein n=1 Tax=Parabacteroides merdae TaxID=46503 RepID=A0A414Y245_9BACT|nr:hypothetical protein [Parabacteroides merdae]RHH80278.1 hypothetical protein DW191_03980 [Parabacteroides merdae]
MIYRIIQPQEETIIMICKFRSDKICKRDVALLSNSISSRKNEKLCQYVDCIFGGSNYQNGGSFCVKSMMCSQFVSHCIKKIYGITIDPSDLLRGKLDILNVSKLIYIDSMMVFSAIAKGDILLLCECGFFNGLSSNSIDPSMDVERLKNLVGYVDTGRWTLFAHVFFYLGGDERKIGGSNHASPYIYGIYKFNDIFDLNPVDCTVKYKNGLKSNSRYFLFACSINRI